MHQKLDTKKVYVGCGEDRREGFLHCDTRALEGVDIVCDAWQLSQHCSELKKIYSRHMLEHLTSMEADAALLDWHKALAIGGHIYIVVPNLDFHIKQWLDANWDEASLRDEKSDARYSFAGLFGWQRECNPKFDDYNRSYWDVHKSGYNLKRMRFLLERAGYVDIELEIKDDVHLVAKATKSMNNGERQIAIDINNVRADHLNRYNFATEILKAAQPRSILDLACGIGYGSQILATKTNAQVLGVDIDQGAIDYASQHYPARQLSYECVDVRKLRTSQQYDAIVSFETIEHVEFDRELLNTFYTLLKSGGTFICSTPNEDVMPFNKEDFKYHIKHYTVCQVTELMEQCGFEVKQVFTQKDAKTGQVVSGSDGCFIILVCQKVSSASRGDE